MNRPTPQEKPPLARVDPLRQCGMGPTLLTFYLFGLVILQFVLVSLGTKSSLRSC
jgi:hypothetical protein